MTTHNPRPAAQSLSGEANSHVAPSWDQEGSACVPWWVLSRTWPRTPFHKRGEASGRGRLPGPRGATYPRFLPVSSLGRSLKVKISPHVS